MLWWGLNTCFVTYEMKSNPNLRSFKINTKTNILSTFSTKPHGYQALTCPQGAKEMKWKPLYLIFDISFVIVICQCLYQLWRSRLSPQKNLKVISGKLCERDYELTNASMTIKCVISFVNMLSAWSNKQN